MIFKKKLNSTNKKEKHIIQNRFDSEEIQMIKISSLKFDKDFKDLFAQEPEKIERIVKDLKAHGFDKSQPIIVTKDLSILDGNSRYLACKEAGISVVPVVVKDFADKKEALKYELHLQLDRRNLNDSQIYSAFQRLEELKSAAKIAGKSTDDFTDTKLAEQLKKSERQIQKMRELSKKADSQIVEKITSGEITINQAYAKLKQSEKPKEQKPENINKVEFSKGVRFALNELAKGKTTEEILATL